MVAVALAAGRRTGDAAKALALAGVVGAGTAAVRIGLIGTVVFGVWLVFSVNAYAIWDAWILATLVLWFVTGGLADRTAGHLRRAARASGDELVAALHSRRMLRLHAAASAAAIAALALMVWKPGA
jgi:hypothetical protein